MYQTTDMSTLNGSKIDDSRCQWIFSGTKSLPSAELDKLVTLKKFNNSWYNTEKGELKTHIAKGVIRAEGSHLQPAWDRQDHYTKSRNKASDLQRYSYIQDCTDEINRDYTLRFASTVLPKRKPHLFTRGGRPIHISSFQKNNFSRENSETYSVLPVLRPQRLNDTRSSKWKSFGTTKCLQSTNVAPELCITRQLE